MPRHSQHQPEQHYSQRSGWLRAAVLGANDGIVSTASLLVGVAAAQTDANALILAGTAGLVAGAMSMAAGEYISVSSQADTEQADLQREQYELDHHQTYELDELKRIYIHRGLSADLAAQVAHQLMAHDALAAHARDELGLSDMHKARPLQAAVTSAFTFAAGAILPLAAAMLAPAIYTIPAIAATAFISLGLLGTLAAHVGGASKLKGALRVMFWSAVAMAATAIVGHAFGTSGG